MFTPRISKLALSAVVAASMLISACADSPESLLSSARDAIAKRDFAAATIHLKNVLQKDSGSPDARFLFAEVLTAQGDSMGAERELRKAIEYGYKADTAVPMLAEALVNSGRPEKALEEFATQKLADKAAQSRLLVALGNAHLAKRQTVEADKKFDEALAVQPGLAAAEVGKVRTLLTADKADEAMRAIDAILAKQPKQQEALLIKADVLSAQGKIDDAIAVAKQAQVNDASDKAPVVRLVSIYLSQGKGAEADAALARLRELAPNDMRTVYFTGVSALRAGKAVEARDAAVKILRTLPTHELALLLGASANLKLGDPKQAETMLSKVVSQRKDWAVAKRMLAQTYLTMRDPARAIEILKPLIELDARDMESINMAGQAHMMMADYTRAAEYFSMVSALKPESGEARTRLGMARMAAGDDSRALHDLEMAAASGNAGILAEVGIIATHLRKGDMARAMQVLESIEKRHPDNAAVSNIRGAVMLGAKDMPGARKAFERALTQDPENVGALTQLTRLDVTENKITDARKRLDAFVQKTPKNVHGALLFAQFLQETHAPTAEVRAALDKAVAADPARNEARSVLIQYLLRTSEGKQALNIAQQAVGAQPDNTDMLRLLGRTQMAAGEKLQAVTTFAKLQAAEPKSPAALFDLAEAQRATEDMSGAENNLRRALEIKPDFSDAAQRLAGIYMRANKPGEALQLAKAQQKANPASPAGFMLEADVLAFDKRWPEVAAALQIAWQKSKSPQVMLALRTAMNLQGKTAEAQKMVTDYLKANPKDGVVRMQLADEALKESKYAEALSLYKTLNELAKSNVVIANNLAWVAHKQGDAKAMEYAEEVLKLAPKVPAVMETVGTILLDRGQTQRGVAMIKEAVELAPKASAVRLGYARALAKTGDKAAAAKEATKALEGVPESLPLHGEIIAFRKTL